MGWKPAPVLKNNKRSAVPRTRLKVSERAFSVAAPSMGLAANRIQADAFHASFQVFLEKISGIALLNWTV